ncbi:2-polyprenyl-6-methoxyphenol hydroxylase-like FAD-dependent oxidoreductase [Curtobacterium sp. PhB137]|uniref:FAD-dependent monooxygenase n=1 Tax=Curtobacterium sp. PhB137 TaxID=2485182 RepID=UPI000F4DD1BF|nr:FAD-dependent monooxygenase [Curtobacterium sp. PhB137]RPE74756.1 2-polyprenyl-6-methoxyphenol hydroxylase-like FAD-dependent oxidoreductase [Curtobacterium sp. PhB137]
MTTALIVGAGIAGDTLALCLARDGWEVTVVEIAPALRTGGQTVDLRGDSRQVLVDLGIIDAALEHLIPQRGIAWIRADGSRMAEMPVEAFGGRGFISREELLRADLARLLHDEARAAGVVHRFADTVDALTDAVEGIDVRFRSGRSGSFDLVVGADGTHSRTRALRFGPESRYRKPLGLAHAWFTLDEQPETPLLDGWAMSYNEPGRRGLTARPGHDGQQEVGMTFAASTVPRDRDEQLTLLGNVFAGTGWRAAEFLRAARTAPDFALDTYDQILLPDTWSDGRVVLIGDAAWCASPLSGLGTALGLRGAAELARALRQHGVHGDASGARMAAALQTFEGAMRPRAAAAQKLLPGRVSMVAPKRQWGIRMNAVAMRMLQTRALLSAVGFVTGSRGHNPASAENAASSPTADAR